MSLRIIYGRAGTGKSEFIFNEINEKITNDEKIYIITPEQFSFTAEKKLMQNRKSILNAEIITFNRMAYRVQNEIGGVINKKLTKCGKSMLIYSILQKEKNNLNLLNKSDENIDSAMRTISEFKKNEISITDLKNETKNINDEYLKMKLNDMILIYEKFNLNIENKYIDETDLLSNLAENIDKINLFKNSIFYIDEFVGYTKQELEIIKKLIKISKQITITFCVDNLNLNTDPNIDIFYPNKITLKKILNLINKDEKIDLINLENNYRFKNEELKIIEKNLYNNKIKKYNNKINNIKLFLAQNKFSEIENIAKEINNLIKKENYKYNDIAIITKNVDEYSSLFKSIFYKYEIPVYIDEKKDLDQNILVRYVLSILEIIIKNYSYESIFNYLKINFLDLDENDIFKLEKYCIKYGIKNNKIKKDFIYGINEKNKEEINYLNDLRKKIINPIINLENKINKKQNIENIIKKFYLFLEEQKIENKINLKINKIKNKLILNNKNNLINKDELINNKNKLNKKIIKNELNKRIIKNELINEENDFEKNNKKINYENNSNRNINLKNNNFILEEKINKYNFNLLELINEYKISYEIIINIFDEIANIFKDEKMTLDNFYKIFKIGLKNSDLGKIPSVQDGVTVGDTDRSRTHKVRAIFIIGLNDGTFPGVNKNEGFFNDNDREFLKEEGIELAKGTLENLYDENFNIYKAFNIAEEKLFLSYCQSDSDGKSLRPSTLILKIKKIFPTLKEESDILEKNENIINEKIIYEKLILNINKLNNKNSLIKNNLENINLINDEKKENNYLNNKINLIENKILKNNYEEKNNSEKIIEKNENNLLENKKIFLFYKYFSENKKYKNKIKNNLNYIRLLKMPEKIKEENIKKLYGNKLNTSISKLETFSSCPYEYFLQYSLKIKEKEELKVKNLDTGSFMHDVIDSFFQEINKNNLNVKETDEEKIEEIINKIINEKLNLNKNYIFNATEKYKLLVKRLKRIILKAIKYIIISLKASDFNIKGTEISFDEKKGTYNPIIINLENGNRVEIIGKIDRVDIAKNEDGKYIRIIDYKSSVKDIDYTQIYAGLQLQLITYLDAMCKIEDFIPAGILYFNLLEQMINSDKKLTDEEIEERIKDNFKMKGLILADVKVAKMQDNNLTNSTASKIIPAYLDKEGNLSPKKSKIATKEEFKKIQNYVDKTIKEISKEILEGNIKLKPYYKNKKTPCEYCNFKNICGFNSGIFKTEYRFINKKTKEDILEG